MFVYVCASERVGGAVGEKVGWDREREKRKMYPLARVLAAASAESYRTPPSGGSKFGFSVLSPGHTNIYTHTHTLKYI